MVSLTVSSKGQMTFRKELLQHIGIQPGDRVSVEKLPGGRIELKAARPTGKISDAFGMLKRDDGLSFTIEEINEAIAAAWAGER